MFDVQRLKRTNKEGNCWSSKAICSVNSFSRGISICVMCAIFISSRKFIHFFFRYYRSSKDFPLVIFWFSQRWTRNTVNTWRMESFLCSQQSNVISKLLFVCALNIQLFYIVCALMWIYGFYVLKRVHHQQKLPRIMKAKQFYMLHTKWFHK